VGDVAVVLIVILVIVLLIRGPKTLPELGAILGRGIRGARDEASRMRSGDPAPDDQVPPPTA
jgi:Sec-independent protein translocase protein TatA